MGTFHLRSQANEVWKWKYNPLLLLVWLRGRWYEVSSLDHWYEWCQDCQVIKTWNVEAGHTSHHLQRVENIKYEISEVNYKYFILSSVVSIFTMICIICLSLLFVQRCDNKMSLSHCHRCSGDMRTETRERRTLVTWEHCKTSSCESCGQRRVVFPDS